MSLLKPPLNFNGPGTSTEAAWHVCGRAAAYNPQADVGSLTRASGHIPGYSGHVPKNSEHTAAPRATHDKTLVMENFKTNMKGYTGHTK